MTGFKSSTIKELIKNYLEAGGGGEEKEASQRENLEGDNI